jgi:hypothetical protein
VSIKHQSPDGITCDRPDAVLLGFFSIDILVQELKLYETKEKNNEDNSDANEKNASPRGRFVELNHTERFLEKANMGRRVIVAV